MRKDKTSVRKLNRILTICMSVVLLSAIILTIVAMTYNKVFSDTDFNATKDSYSSNQAQIVEPKTTTSTETISMTDAYANKNSIGTKTITIANDTELLLFSSACNTDTDFLAKSYKLISNIKHDNNSLEKFKPVGYKGTAFSGVFDGNGYEISNLKMEDITPQIGNEAEYASMQYYAMFSVNSGEIKNLGLVEFRSFLISSELDNIVNNDGGVANLVGKNESSGKVQFCYYKDLRDFEDNDFGIGCYSASYRMAGLVFYNAGTFKDCYIAASTVAAKDVNGYEAICSLCYKDENYNASTSNLYYYDGSIETYSSVGGAREITYKNDMFEDATFLDEKQDVGIYCANEKLNEEGGLNTYYADTTGVGAGWYLPSKYDNGLKDYIKNETPIRRYLTYTKSEGIYTFDINNTDNFLYMYELMNGSDFFAGDAAIYKIKADIDLNNIEPSNYYYKNIMMCTITGEGSTGSIQPKLVTNSTSTYPTIYNFNAISTDRKVTTVGIDAYGLFPYVGGTISYLNIIPNDFDMKNVASSNNVKGISAVSGFVEKGRITNVNVYLNASHSSTDIKEYYLGGICAILGGEGTIDNCTVGGSFNISRFTATAVNASAYTVGNAIGGVVGYICRDYGSIKTCLSGVDIDFGSNAAAVDYQIGGVVGAAYTIEAENLEFVGSIDVGYGTATQGAEDGSRAQFNSLYVAGIIGRHLGVQKQVKNFTNQGNITVASYPTDANNKGVYVAGIENADIKTAKVDNTGLIASTDKTKDGKYRFRASSLTNRADVITISNKNPGTIELTSGINVFAKNGFITELSGVYNLNYKELYNSSATKTITTLGSYDIYMNNLYRYSGVVNVLNGDALYTTSLETVYNLRDITLTTYGDLSSSSDFKYFGTVRGKYINYSDVRNEGSITLTTTNTIGSNVIIAGVLEEVSEKCSADNIFNGGNISFTYSGVVITGDVKLSGICYKNSGYDSSSINKYNPSSNDFDSKAKGSLNNVINNGSITVDNPTDFANNSNIVYNYARVASANGMSYLGSFSYTSDWTNAKNITGNIFTSGVVTYNEAPITNTFNLGDILAVNYINSTTTEKEINAAGIAGLNIGKYAYILNSANNGNIKAINLSTGKSFDVGKQNQVENAIKSYTDYLSNVNASGIIARNDELENGTSYSSNTTNPNSSQIVSFTINYGDIYSYNYRTNTQSTAQEPKAKSAGIVAMGLLNTINVMNYGNIYGSETASGIFGVMYFAKFKDEATTSNKVNIANTINYGNVYMLSKGYNNAHGDSYADYAVIKYSRLKQFDNANNKVITSAAINGSLEAFTDVTRNANFVSSIGSVFALANYSSEASASNIVIRYLISFNSACPIVGATVAAPSGVSVDTTTLYSAHISTNAASGAYQNDKWINSFVQYAPLSTGSVSGTFVTAIDAATGEVSKASNTYYGIFNSNFAFSKAILGSITLDTNTNPTDAYLTDYFQFVGFQYINPVLFEKIGWQTLAYSTAANDFTMNVSNVIKVLDKSNGFISTVSTAAKTPFSWMSNSVAEDLNTLIDSLASEENYSDLKTVLQYIYSDDSQSNIFITTNVRSSILNKLISSNDELLPYLTDVLQYTNGYSSTLAKSIVIEEDEVKALIDRYVEDLDDDVLVGIYDSYITYLDSNNNSYFSYGNNENIRVNALNTLFSSIDDSTFYRELVTLLGIEDSSLSSSARMLAGYKTLDYAGKSTLFKTIVTYNLNNIDTYLGEMATDIDYYKELVANGLTISSEAELYEKAQLYSGSSATSEDVVNERITLWNLIRNTNVFNTNFTNANYGVPTTTYFKATEYNNTYQSVTEPHNGGAYVGDTTQNRLSYYYTKDVTPATYFYGPYTSNTTTTITLKADDGTQTLNNPTIVVNKKNLNADNRTYHSLFHYTDRALWNSNEIMKSRGGNNSTVTYSAALQVAGDVREASENHYNDQFPQLIYYDFNNEQIGGANDLFTLNSNYYTSGPLTTGTYKFYGFNAAQLGTNKSFKDPITGASCSASDWCGTILGNNDYYMYVSSTGEKFSLNNATMGPYLSSKGNVNVTLSTGVRSIHNHRFYIQDSDGANHPVQASGENETIEIGRYVNGVFVAEHVLKHFYTSKNQTYARQIYSLITDLLGLRMYTSTASYNLHSTARTGIYRRRSGDSNDFSNYYTWKQTEKVHVYTSQYIDYKYSDLLNLDGVLTEYDGKVASKDERDIINKLFNSYFLTSSHYSNFRKLVKAALLEALGNNSTIETGATQTNGEIYIDNFFTTNIYASAQASFSNKIPFAYLYRQNNQTVQAYLNSLQSFTGDNKNLLIYGSAINQTIYINLLKRLRSAKGITSNANYANYKPLLDYLATNSGYITNDRVVLSNFSSLNLSNLETYLACFDDNSEVNITNLYAMSSEMSAFTGSTVYNQATYNSTTYSNGLKFSSMTLTPEATNTRLILVAKSTGSSSTLTCGSQTVEVSSINEYGFLTNGETSITITSDNDVIVYAIYYVTDVETTNQQLTNVTDIGTYVDNVDSMSPDRHTSYFTVAKSEVESKVNSAIQTAVGNDVYYHITSITTVANITVTSTATNPGTMYLADGANVASYYAGTQFTCNANTTSNTTLTMTDDYYGDTIYAVQLDGTVYKNSYWRYISAVNYTITYSYIADRVYQTRNFSVASSIVTLTNATHATMPTLNDIRNTVLTDCGRTSWDNSSMAINSVTARITAKNVYNNDAGKYTLYLCNGTSNYVYDYIDIITDIPYNGTGYTDIDLTSYYGSTLSIRYKPRNQTYYVEDSSDLDFTFYSYSYTVNYSISGYYNSERVSAVSNDNIRKDRLLNLSLPNYSEIQNRYFSYIYNNSTNANTKYADFVKTNVTNFVPINTSGNDNSPTNPFVDQLTDAKKAELAYTIITNNNAALYYFISETCSTNAKLAEVLKVMAGASNGYSFVADAIVKLDNMPSSSATTDKIDQYPNVLKALVATYIVADYRRVVSIGGTINNTVYSSLVTNVNNNASGNASDGTAFKNNINYINTSTGAINSTKYNYFVEYILGASSATTSYGIFALASSRGIQNGAFIPDNVSLRSMDVCYDTTTKLNNVSYISLTTNANQSWRANVSVSSASNSDTSVNTSVNYHVLVEMKQLVKAISNVIFELDLECNDITLYSSTNQIDYGTKEITYYVSETYYNYIKNASQLKIKELIIADTATADKAVNDYIILTNKITETTNKIQVADAITITPEEHAYTAVYKINFVKVDTTVTNYRFYSMYYETAEGSGEYNTANADSPMLIPYYGARVTFEVTATLTNGMDLSSFFSVTGQEKNVTWEFDPDTDNNCIVDNGKAYITINVDISMSQGSKAFVLNLYGTSNTVNRTKDGNTNAAITAFGYDGQDRSSTLNSSKSIDSSILFGRAFNYDELTKPYILTTDTAIDDSQVYYSQSGSSDYYSYTEVKNPVVADIATYYVKNDNFYLYSFGVSSNATFKITATKTDDTVEFMKYTVTYSVKPESGTAITYTHNLTEMDYFTSGDAYGHLYKDGDELLDDDLYKTDFEYNSVELPATDCSNLTYNKTASANFVAVTFNRGLEPQYRIKYELSNFYGDQTKYTVTEGEANVASTSPQNTYAGITITLDDEKEPGVYKYNYVYTNTGEWVATGTYVKLADDATYDSTETYYLLTDGEYVQRTVSRAQFRMLKSRLYIYQEGTGGTYTRTYTFPALYIYKDFSTDALFHKLTFLDESKLLGTTASVMLATNTISAASTTALEAVPPTATKDDDAYAYDSIFNNYQTNKIRIEANQITYTNDTDSADVTDYYTVGSVSDTDLENYAPVIKLEDHAQIFKYTTLTKLTKYGADNKQDTANGGNAYKDSEILTTRSDMLLYIPFVTGTGSEASYEVFLVLLDSNMRWTKVYNKDFKGTDLTQNIKEYTTPFTTKEAEDNPALTTFTYDSKSYTIADYAGDTNVTTDEGKNISLYMDFIGDPLENHFWYISYVVFSEYYLSKGMVDKNNDGKDDNGAVRYYHISIVDASNTVYFDVSLYAPENFKLDEIYLTFAENTYDKSTNVYTGSTQLSCYLEKELDENNNLVYGAANTKEAGLVKYKLKLSMAALPPGYFSFYADLPNGYGAICYTNKDNEIDKTKEPGKSNQDTYLPHTTIIPITIGLKIIVSELTGSNATVWAVNTSDLYTRKITYMGVEAFE